MTAMLRLTTLADRLLFVLLLLCVIGSFVAVTALSLDGAIAIISVDGESKYKLLLSEDKKVTVRGAIGEVEVKVEGGKVAVTRANCPNRICVRTGWRARGGEVIVCVPNRLWVKILSREEVGVKGVTG